MGPMGISGSKNRRNRATVQFLKQYNLQAYPSNLALTEALLYVGTSNLGKTIDIILRIPVVHRVFT